jgi:hypothetical protein
MVQPPGQQQAGYDAEQEYAECRFSHSGGPHDKSEGSQRLTAGQREVAADRQGIAALGVMSATLTRELFHEPAETDR